MENVDEEGLEAEDEIANAEDETRLKPFFDMHAARKLTEGTPPTLFSILLLRRGFEATDKRDLIYGNLAVAHLPSENNDPPCPVVNYDRSIAEVFTDATTHMLLQDKEALLHVEVSHASLRMSELPSWVPDWSRNSSEHLIPYKFKYKWKLHEFYATYIEGSYPQFPIPNVCAIRCVKIDTVKFIKPVIPPMKAYSQMLPVEVDPTIVAQMHEALLKRHGRLFDMPPSLQFFAGRNIAELYQGGLGIVPPTSQSGDEIHAISVNNRLRLLVLRPYDYPTTMKIEQLEDDIDIDLPLIPVITGNYRLIGCAWVEENCTVLRDMYISASAWEAQSESADRRRIAVLH